MTEERAQRRLAAILGAAVAGYSWFTGNTSPRPIEPGFDHWADGGQDSMR